VVGFDRNLESLAILSREAERRRLAVSAVRADLETGHGIPVRPGSCGAILVFRFLFRPLASAIESALALGGLLLYETFTCDQEKLGYGPANPALLLLPDELPRLFPHLEVSEHWEGVTEADRPEAVARLVARKLGRPRGR
jgi:hypothetical protein